MALSTVPNGTPVSARDPLASPGLLDLPRLSDFPASMTLKWTWSCRAIAASGDYRVSADRQLPPRPGDIVLGQVEHLGFHDRLMTTRHERLRLYEGDVLVGVMGNRYATDAYEAEVEGLDQLHVLTGAGMFGTIRSAYHGMKRPTRLEFLGYLCDAEGQRINLKQMHRPFPAPDRSLQNVVLMVGTGMNSGKTTTATQLVKGLLRQGLRVAACKVTGSVSHRDLNELISTGVHHVRDFSDYGFPSTYLCDQPELLELFEAMLTDAAQVRPDVVVMEIADGMLQRETRMLLESEAVRQRVRGVVLTAGCAPSGLFGVQQVKSMGYPIAAVSGRITSSPLFVREFSGLCDVPVGSSVDGGDQLAKLVSQRCRLAC